MRLGVAERVSGMRTLRTTGRVAPNENAVYPLVAGADGLVRDVRGATTGSLVKKDEVLLWFYAPEFLTAQQFVLLRARHHRPRRQRTDAGHSQTRVADSVERFANTLRNLGVSEEQLAEMRATRKLAPVRRDCVAGRRLRAPARRVGRPALSIGASSSTASPTCAGCGSWPTSTRTRRRSSAPGRRPGSPRRTRTASSSQGQPRRADLRRGDAHAEDAAGNRQSWTALKPGMFVDVRFDIDLPLSLSVPAEAIVDSGLRKTVFVYRGNGFFEPRSVETGWRLGDQLEIVKGLMPGERIVISGTFLVDSESRMKAAPRGIFGAVAVDPICGMDVDEKRATAAGRTSQHNGTTYYFCSDDCKKQFDAEPAKYLAAGHDHAPAAPAMKGPAAPMPTMGTRPRAAAAEPATVKDLVCGMDIDPADAVAAKLTSEYKGTTYYFRADDCKRQFDAEPGQWVGKL